MVPVYSRADVSYHIFWKQGNTAIFYIHIFNIDVGYYLRMTPNKGFTKAEKDNKEIDFRIVWSVRET